MTSLMPTPALFNIFKVASATPRVEIANPQGNVANILELLDNPELRNADFVVFPELCITGYTCGDLFFQNNLIDSAQNALSTLCGQLKGDSRLIAVGLPIRHRGRLYNCAAIICRGEIQGIVPKSHIPNYQEFYEKRWFSSGEGIEEDSILINDKPVSFGTNLIFLHNGVKTGVEICEDLWVPEPPSSALCMDGAELILNLSATDDNIGKYDYLRSLIAAQSARCRCAYAYSSAGQGESSTDLVFSGINIIASDGKLLGRTERFSYQDSIVSAFVDFEKLRNDRRKYSSFYPESPRRKFIVIDTGLYEPREDQAAGLVVDPHPFIPGEGGKRNESCREIIEIQSWGLSQRLKATGCKNLVVGISGGLDSTLALLIAHHAFKKLGLDLKGIHGVTMPSYATSSRTHSNAGKLMDCLGVSFLEIPVHKAVEQHFRDIDHDPETTDAVYENSQARERTQILMDLANKYSGMVLGTGDMSELALGWCTYNGDHMSMYNVNAGVPKTLVKHLVQWFADSADSKELSDVLADVIDTPISPELVPSTGGEDEIAQKTEDIVGPYELHDFFLFHVLRNGYSPAKIMFLASIAFSGKYPNKVIKKWLVNFYRRFFSQQFKRSCMPDGPKIGSVCLSPRGDWRMPSDACAKLWITEAEGIEV